MKRSQLKKTYFKKKELKNLLKNIKNKNITAANYTSGSEKVFLKAYILVK